jgi:hypothetical protein
LRVQGDADEVEAFLDGIAESELKSHIKKIDVHPAPRLEGARGFEIVP